MQISGTRALVTGAAGGLGDAISRELAARGSTITASGRNQAGLERLANQLAGDVELCDLTDHEQVDALAGRVGEWDILVANAGTGGDVPIEQMDDAHIDDFISINLRAPIVLATRFIQQRRAAGKGGHVVLIGSLSGVVATPESRMYNATKFGLRGFGLSLRQDLTNEPIGVSVVAPGFVRDAGMFANNDVELPPGVRTSSPAEVGRAVARAIEKDLAEVFVAPREVRVLASFGGLAPRISERIQQRLGVAERKRGK